MITVHVLIIYLLIIIKVITCTLSNSSTDHYSIFVLLSKFKAYVKNENFPVMNYKQLKNSVNKVNWNSIFLMRVPNQDTDVLIKKITTCVQRV